LCSHLSEAVLTFCTTMASKTSTDYWKTAIYKRKFKRVDGSTYEGTDFQCRMTIEGKMTVFPLGTANAKTAAGLAKDIYMYAQVNGRKATIGEFKETKTEKKEVSTVGDLIAYHQKSGHIKPKTLETYRRKFFTLVAGIWGIRSDSSKYNYLNGGNKNYRAKIEAVKLESITPDLVKGWRGKYIESHGGDPVKRKQAEKTASSILRNAKSLFNPDYLPESLPSPFEGIKIGKPTIRKYRSTIDPKKLALDAKKEFWIEIPKNGNRHQKKNAVLQRRAFQCFLLALIAGLRRKEIDLLMWEQVYLDRNIIHVRDNKWMSVKTEQSEREIDIPDALVELLKGWQNDSKGEFVIESEVEPKPEATYDHYRLDAANKRLTKWLRSQGLPQENPIHSLRKEYGSIICEKAGVFAASAALGHSSITITRDAYLDRKSATTVDGVI